MKIFRVAIFNLQGELMCEHIVRSKTKRQAIANVVTNIYRGDDVSTVSCWEVKI